MLVVMNSQATEKDIKRVAMFIEAKGFEARVSHGEARTVIHAIGLKEVDLRDLNFLTVLMKLLNCPQTTSLQPEPAKVKIQL